MKISEKNLWVMRGVVVSWLIGWFVKGVFFIPYFLQHIETYPVHHSFFPVFFQYPYVAKTAYFLPVIVFIGFFSNEKRIFQIVSGLMLICSMVLATHSDTYNDATFVTSFWAALWLLWFSSHANREDAPFYRHACLLAKCVVGVIFAGGVAGKLTPEYWNGDAIYHIFVKTRMYWPFNFIREIFPFEQSQYGIATMISRGIIFIEAFLALTPFWPTRFICFFAPVMMLGLIIFSTWMILSVVSCLIGLLLCVNCLTPPSLAVKKTN